MDLIKRLIIHLIAEARDRWMAARGGGAVVTVASLAGQRVIPQAKVSASPAYAAAKAGLLMLTRQAAREFAGSGVRSNAISPRSVTNTRIARFLSGRAGGW